MAQIFAIEQLLEELSEMGARLQDLSEQLERAEADRDDREMDWHLVARMESDRDQLEAMLEELGIPDNPSVAQLLAIKAAIAEALLL